MASQPGPQASADTAVQKRHHLSHQLARVMAIVPESERPAEGT